MTRSIPRTGASSMRNFWNVVLVLMLTTSIVGPVLTQRFLPRMLAVVRAKIHQGG
jgi:hypothetical protein